MLWQRKKEAQEIEFFAPFALQLFVSLIECENHVKDLFLKNDPTHRSKNDREPFSQFLKITQNVTFEVFNFDIFHQFLSR